MAKCVTYFLGNGIMTSRTRRELAEDIAIGTLVAINDEGKLVKATNDSAGAKRAVVRRPFCYAGRKHGPQESQ